MDMHLKNLGPDFLMRPAVAADFGREIRNYAGSFKEFDLDPGKSGLKLGILRLRSGWV